MKETFDLISWVISKSKPPVSCTGCNNNYCCRGQKGISVSNAWVKRMRPLITPEQKKRYNNMRTDGLIDCPFNGDDGKCEIYEDRPLVCAMYHVLCDPEDCNTDKKIDGIEMVDPSHLINIVSSKADETVMDQLKNEVMSGSTSILDVFR